METQPHAAARLAHSDKRVIADAPSDTGAFLEWLKDQPEDFRYELSNGTVIETMVWVTRAHWIVTGNLLSLLLRLLDRKRFIAGPAEFGVKTPWGVRFTDALVVPPGGTAGDLAADDPILVAEVLSPSSVSTDFLEKLPEYQGVPSLAAYLILSQDEPRAWVWIRDGGDWPSSPTEFVGRDETVPLPVLGVELAMADLFAGISDAPTLDRT